MLQDALLGFQCVQNCICGRGYDGYATRPELKSAAPDPLSGGEGATYILQLAAPSQNPLIPSASNFGPSGPRASIVLLP